MSRQSPPEDTAACDLCGLPLPAHPWRLQTIDRGYTFCCEGCLGIFRLLHDPEEVSPSVAGSDPGQAPFS